MTVAIDIVQGEATEVVADTLILKFAHTFHGADLAVARRMADSGADITAIAPPAGSTVTVDGQGIGAKRVLFVGTPRLSALNYREVGEIVRIGLAALPNDVRHVAFTIHGPGIGLDETQAFLSMLQALYTAMALARAPKRLERVTFVERHPGRAQRLREVYAVSPRPTPAVPTPPAGPDPDKRPHVFVAMPFGPETDDIFYYGIQRPIHAAGLLCERVDHSSFTGDIVDRILRQIETAELVIAECTGANPNVYLEIGYAWGKNRDTLLLARSVDELRFDVRGHRTVVYQRILDLEAQLTKELARIAR